MEKTGATKKNSAAQLALDTVEDRQQKYGSPRDNFTTIATLWYQYLHRAGYDLVEFTTRDVAMMMLLVKVAREAHSHNRDNIVDIIGYAECYDRL